jgi:gamma-glutamyltranspeptidase/glutathione hydrolase
MTRSASGSSLFIPWLAAASVALAGQTPQPTKPAPVTAQHAMVVSIHHDATDAGVEILDEGGNAVDAAVAVGFALAVVYPAAGNLGGGGFMLIRPGSKDLAHGQPRFLDFREQAPAAASADMYLNAQGNVLPQASTLGARASGVPGTIAGLTYAEQHYGLLGLKAVMQPAIRLASEGYVLSAEEAADLHSGRLAQFPGSRRIFQRNGNFYKAGDRFVQPELTRTLLRIAASPDDFYKGRMAAEFAAFEKENDGLITAQDLAAYQVKERAPLLGHYHGLEILTAPPPSSGGVLLIEILNILSGYDLPKLGADRSPAQVHLITEAYRRAYMDRSDYLGDPDFNKLPIEEMSDPAYAAAWRKSIDPVKPTPSASLIRPEGFLPASPKIVPDVHESQQTTHFSIVDGDGNAVACTYTLNFGFGSGVSVDGLGFLLNDEMDDFTVKAGAPNGYGLVQGPANAIAPGKRPLSSMTPTIVSEPPHKNKLGKVRLVLGSPGGSTIITTVANDLISVVDNGLDVQTAADAPRFHHQYLPDVLEFEKMFPVSTVDALRAAGYITHRAGEAGADDRGVWGDSELIAVDPVTGLLYGGQDQRHHFGKASGY